MPEPGGVKCFLCPTADSPQAWVPLYLLSLRTGKMIGNRYLPGSYCMLGKSWKGSDYYPNFTWENRTGRCPRPPQPTLPLYLFHFLPVSPSNLQNWAFRPRVPALVRRRRSHQFKEELACFPKAMLLFPKVKNPGLVFHFFEKNLKTRPFWRAERIQGRKIRGKDTGCQFFGSFVVSLGGWVRTY